MAPHISPPAPPPAPPPPPKPARAPSVPYCGTKTVYPDPPASASLVLAPAASTLVHVSFIARHGTRNPTSKGLRRMRELESFLLAAAPHLPWLPEWGSLLAAYEAAEGALTREGEKEMRALGGRFRRRYARMLAAADARGVRAWASAKHRAVESAACFLEGFGEGDTTTPAAIKTPTLSQGEDAVMRYTNCHSGYTRFSARHKGAVFAALASGRTGRATEIADRMARELGAATLLPGHVRVVGEAAAFDLAHGRQSTSPFARLLHPADAGFLEAFDRAYRPFWEGVARYRAVAAPLVRELAGTLRAAQTGRAPTADLKFAHSQTLVPILLLLGIEGNGLCKRRGEYVPGLSAMLPFAANFCMEVFQTKGKRFLVRFRLHERYIADVPALGEKGRGGVVPIETLLEFFDGIVAEKEQAQGAEVQVAAGGHAAVGPIAGVVPVAASARAVAE